MGEGGCGNGIVESGEQCDDGNDADGDGCSGMCMSESISRVASSAAEPTAITGSLPAGGAALVQLEAAVASTLVAEVGNPLPGACDTPMRLVLLDASLAEVGSQAIIATQNGPYPCGRLDPDRTEALSAVAPGTHYLRVESVDGSAVPAFGVRVRLHEGSGCGDGYRQGDELCDDGNADDTDACRADCTLNPLPLATARFTVDMDTPFGPFHRLRVRVPERTTITATITAPGGNGNCGVPTFMGLAGLVPQAAILGLSPAGVPNCGGIDQPSAVYASDLVPGDYDLLAVTSDPSTGGAVTIVPGSVPAACGNGIVEASTGETCDDGNTNPDDACRNDCTENSLRFVELEPNDVTTSANTLMVTPGGPVTIVSARFGTSSDEDFFEIELPAGGELRLETYTADGNRRVCQTVDTWIYLLDGQGNELTNNDDRPDLRNLCSRIDRSGLAAGRYFVRVVPYPGTAAGPYFLAIEAR